MSIINGLSQHLRGHIPLTLPLVLLALLPASAAAMERTADMCVAAAEHAARKTAVPLQVLLALTLTETGRQSDDGLAPWPWALDHAGESLWFDTRDAAMTALQDVLGSGAENIDVGCFQLNVYWHSGAFASLYDMLDPEANALYAAQHIQQLYDRLGDWQAAAAAYHSSTPAFAERYLARYVPIYNALSQNKDPALVLRSNSFPLLQVGSFGMGGSLVPLGAALRPLIGG